MLRKRFILGTAAIVSSCGYVSDGERFLQLADNGEPLRKAFNHDAGKVRIVMLVSPT